VEENGRFKMKAQPERMVTTVAVMYVELAC